MSVCVEARISPHQVPANLIRTLRRHAEESPDQPAFIHLLNGQSKQAALTYDRLEQRARAIAAHLQNMGLAGQRVLLVYPPGLDFITAFFGCLYANCVAAPTYPPHRHRMVNRFHAIADDAEAGIALSTSCAVAQFQSMMGHKSGEVAPLSLIRWLATDEIPDALAERWSEPAIASDTLAMLQYTSGSASQPKGVMLSYANLMDNTHTIHHAFGVRPEDSAVFWLPTYHDMGLVGGILVPVFALLGPNGAEVVFLDEPTTGLDPRARREVWDVLLGLKKKGTTGFLTTHYLEEAELLADTVAILSKGQIIAMGSPGELIESNANYLVLTL